jgi:aspartyl-tRNA synthetase
MNKITGKSQTTFRTHNCNELRPEQIGSKVHMSGWVDTIRDHGGVKFIDLRDHYGVTQIVFHDDSMLSHVNREAVIAVAGTVRAREEDTVNRKLDTGLIEVNADSIEILGTCQNRLPFEIGDSQSTREDVRLKYRFLDLRNPAIHGNIVLRAQVISYLRKLMEELGFLEIQTPVLTAS